MQHTEAEIKKLVREGYAGIAKGGGSCCGGECGCGSSGTSPLEIADLGYTDDELSRLPEGANLGLGCGNPLALAALDEGETVLDLGSGGGIDCFLASSSVGSGGKVIGVDMTPEMIDRARANRAKGGFENVEFRLGEMEALPVADGSVDVVISNCVVNLSPDKSRVFGEVLRVLKPGGRFEVSDIVRLRDLPDATRNSVEEYVGGVAGAITAEDYRSGLESAGFAQIRVLEQTGHAVAGAGNEADDGDPPVVASMTIRAVKPPLEA